MRDTPGDPRSILLIGGSSDIGLAIVTRYLALRPLRVVLAGRPSARLDGAVARLAAAGARVTQVAVDVRDTDTHQAAVRAMFAGGEVDLAIVAAGVLGGQASRDLDHAAVLDVSRVNYLGAVSLGVLLAGAMRRQGHGTIVALSSTAAELPRRSNFVYGAAKAGMDAFYGGLGDRLAGTGVRVLVVRPGQVRTRMTRGLPDRPLTTTPQAVAVAVAGAVRSGRTRVWVPAAMRAAMSVLRHLPRPLSRRLPW